MRLYQQSRDYKSKFISKADIIRVRQFSIPKLILIFSLVLLQHHKISS